MNKTIIPVESINKTTTVPGDKSISHRAVMIGGIAKGDTHIKGFLAGEDCIATIDCFRKMGIEIRQEGSSVLVKGKGLHGLIKPAETLYVGNSGTAIRLLAGVLAGQKFETIVTGDESICGRPMGRIINPLKEMGADIQGKDGGDTAPLYVAPSKLNRIKYTMPVASAQVKSCLLFAGLYGEGVEITEKGNSRDHTEIMLNHFGGKITREGNKVISEPIDELYGKDIEVPGDISSAAYLIVAALILKNSCIELRNIGVNETRTGIIDALKQMGGNIELRNRRIVNGEPVADIIARSSDLKGTEIGGDIIPRMIDEIPIFAVAALMANGTTIVRDAEELKVKESNRIKAMTNELNKIGGNVTETDDGMIIKGGNKLKGGQVESYGDHRVAMSIAVAGLVAEENTEIKDAECVNVSFPGFYETIN